jgi:hypothetical protein
MAFPSTLIDIGRIPELRGVRDDGDAILIGAMTTHHDVMHDQLVRRYAPLIAQATATVGDPQVRHQGTFGGSLAHADPAGDLGAVALVLGCEFVVSGPAGERRLAAADFFVDYLTTALAPAELLTAVRVPSPGTAGPRTTRSSTGSRRHGRSSASPRSSGSTAACRSPRPGSGSPTWDPPRSGRPPPKRHLPVHSRLEMPSPQRPRTLRRAPMRRVTCPAGRITAIISLAC